jgi:hypothetical protein
VTHGKTCVLQGLFDDLTARHAAFGVAHALRDDPAARAERGDYFIRAKSCAWIQLHD